MNKLYLAVYVPTFDGEGCNTTFLTNDIESELRLGFASTPDYVYPRMLLRVFKYHINNKRHMRLLSLAKKGYCTTNEVILPDDPIYKVARACFGDRTYWPFVALQLLNYANTSDYLRGMLKEKSS